MWWWKNVYAQTSHTQHNTIYKYIVWCVCANRELCGECLKMVRAAEGVPGTHREARNPHQLGRTEKIIILQNKRSTENTIIIYYIIMQRMDDEVPILP